MPTPEPHDADTAHMHAAITHALNGRHQPAMAELQHVTAQGPAAVFRLWQHLGQTACAPIRGQGANTTGRPRYGLKAFTQWIGTEPPPAVQTALRFLTAQARTRVEDPHAADGMRRIFTEAQHAPDPGFMDAVLAQLLAAAVEAERQLQAESGTSGSGR